MKIEKVRENRLRITIPAEDLTHWGVTAESIAGNSPAAQDMFFALLRQAEQETGFRANNARLVVEAMPAHGGGVDDLIIYVTRVESEAEEALYERVNRQKRPFKLKAKSSEPAEDAAQPTVVMVEFTELEELVALCHAAPQDADGDLYMLDDCYYLFTGGQLGDFCSEFGRVAETPLRHRVLEHGTLVLKNCAFSALRKNFS